MSRFANPAGELVGKAQNGDRRAWGKLYELFLDRIFRFVRFRVNTLEDAEDITQEVFMKMWRGLNGYRADGAPFEAWLYKIARNSVIDYYRRQKTAVPFDRAGQITDSRKSPEEKAIAAVGKPEALLGLRKLNHNYQEIIILKFIEERNNQEISAILDKPVEQIRVLQSRAVAVGGVLDYLNSASVSVIIKNNGCAPITPVVNAPAFAKASAGKPVSIPGISLRLQQLATAGRRKPNCRHWR